MKCPICGCKMKKEIVCPYCKITGDEVRFASNKEAKRRIKRKETEEVYESTYIPYDVSKKKLLTIAVLGGFIGADAFFVGRYKRALIQSAIIFLSFMMFIMFQYLGMIFLKVPVELMTLVCAWFMLTWITNICNIIFFNKATVPIVLPTKEELKDRIQERDEMEAEKKRQKEEKSKIKYEKMVEKEKENLEKQKMKKEKKKDKNRDK